jgi:hypothetical protein
MSAILDEIERDRSADKPRSVDLPEVGGGDER